MEIKSINMKKYLLILTLPLVLFSCKSNDKEADAYGNFESDEIIISSEVSGKIIQFNFEEGDLLKAGDLICLIDTVPLWLKLESLKAQKRAISSRGGNVTTQADVLKQQRANLEKELDRINNLLKDGAATLKQRDDLLYQISVIDKQIENVRSQNSPIGAEAASMDTQMDQILDQIKRSSILCPIDASILTKYVNASEIVTVGKPIVKIANLKVMYLKAYVSGDQLSSIKLGQKVTVRIDNNKNGFDEIPGTITWISQQAEFTPKIIQTKQERVNLVYAIKVQIENNGIVKIGMPGEVVFN